LPDGASEADWLLLRGNLERLSDFADWFAVIAGDVDPPELGDEDRALVGEAARLAPTFDWSNEPWKALADALKASTGLKGRALFHPLRLALTGRESGPEMAGLLTRMGQDRAVARLHAAAVR
jgi:glutamyl-tRNA synthetase